MLNHPTIDRLRDLGLVGMIHALEEQQRQPDSTQLTFEDRLAMLVDREVLERDNKRLKTRLRFAGLRQMASPEDVDYRAHRGLDRGLFQRLAQGEWIERQQNLLITGPTGVGKTWIACALGHRACRDNRSVLYQRVPRMLEGLGLARGDGRYARMLKSLSRVHHSPLSCPPLSPASCRSTTGMPISVTRRFHDASLLDRLVRRTVARSSMACPGVSMICQGMPLASCFPLNRPFRSQSNMTWGVMPIAAAAPCTE